MKNLRVIVLMESESRQEPGATTKQNTICRELEHHVQLQVADSWDRMWEMLLVTSAEMLMLHEPSWETLRQIRTVKTWFPSVRILVVCAPDAQKRSMRAAAFGADSVLPADASVSEVLDAIRLSVTGYSILRKDMFQSIISWFQREYLRKTDAAYSQRKRGDQSEPSFLPPSFRADLLNRTEVAVLMLVLDGRTNRQIAGKLYLSEGYVKKW